MNARVIPYLLIAPSLAFLAILFFVPLVQTVALAFQAGGIWTTENFTRMTGDLNLTGIIPGCFTVFYNVKRV
jgi:multiple sugar transport system permease protein